MSDFRKGDRVSIEGTVEAVDGWMVFVTLSDSRSGWTKESGLTLLDRPVPQPEPTGLVERVARVMHEDGWTCDFHEPDECSECDEARAATSVRAALAVATWLDECVHDGYRRAAKRIRREVEGGDRG